MKPHTEIELHARFHITRKVDSGCVFGVLDLKQIEVNRLGRFIDYDGVAISLN